MSDDRWPLPETWSWARSADMAKIVGGGTPRADDERNFTENGIKWITPADLTGYSDVYIGGGRRDLSERGLATSGATLLPKGTVLFSSRAPVGYCAIAANEMSTNQGFKSLVLDDEILPEYVRYYLLSSKEYAESLASGTTFLELSGKRMAELQIPLAPLPEQRRIVRKLDTLSVRTTTARADLTAIEKLAGRYKKGIYANHFAKDEDRVPLSSLAQVGTGATPKKGNPRYYKNGSVPWVTSGAVNAKTVLAPSDYITEAALKETNCKLFPAGSLLMAMYGEGKTRGQIARLGIEAATNQALAVIHEIDVDQVDVDYLYHFLDSIYLEVRELAEGGVQPNLSLGKVKAFELPLPTLDEQREIVRQIKTSFVKVDCLASEADKALKLADRLDQRILAKAFAGELVSQDPNDEPASALLERIRDARANAPKKPRKKLTKAKPMKVAPQERVLTDSAEWPEQGLPFEDIAKRLTLPHDDLKDAVFALLEGDAPKLRQEFDTDAKVMKLVRVAT